MPSNDTPTKTSSSRFRETPHHHRRAPVIVAIAVVVAACVLARFDDASFRGSRARIGGGSWKKVKRMTSMKATSSTTLEARSADTPLTVSDLIFGASPLAGIYEATTYETARETVKAALDVGFTRFDTAPHYGLGLSERRLGQALADLNADMTRIKVYTKVGRVMKPLDAVTEEEKQSGKVEWGNVPGDAGCIFPEAPTDVLPVLDYTADGFERSHADSLSRLGIDRIEGLRIHDAETTERFEDAMRGGGVRALAALRDSGAISEVSLGMNDASYIMRMLNENEPGTFDSVMMAGSWNLLDQDGLDVLLECQTRGVAVHNAGIFASGLLVGGSHYKYGPAPPEILDRVDRWKRLCAEHDVTLPAAAIAFACAPSVVTLCAVGVKSPDEARQAARWLADAAAIPRQFWLDALDRALLRRGVPLPFQRPA